MEIILSKQCESLTGSLGKGYGYYIRRARHQDGSVHFYSQRSKHPPIPRDGHLRFIFTCAELTQNRLHIADIRVSGEEIYSALKEAGLDADLYPFDFEVYNAKWVLDFKNKCGL